MLVILPFHSEDQDRALNLAHWIAELGTVQNHQALVVCDKLSDPQIAKDIENALGSVFRHTALMPLREAAPGTQGANLLFKRALRQVQASNAGPFLWLHPDAVPLREGWLDALAAAWALLPKGKHFLGAHLVGAFPFMSPVGIYPADAEVHAPNLVMAENNPFHLNAAPQVVPKMAQTSLIVDSHEEPITHGVEAVLWHGSQSCRDGRLIAYLRDHDPLPPLEILTPTPQQNGSQESQKFVVPEKALPVDRSAQQAASRAGSDGIPSDEIDTSTQVPRTAPPAVNPVRMPASIFTPEMIQPGVFPKDAGNISTEKHATAAALTTAAQDVSEAALSENEGAFAATLQNHLAHIVTTANVDSFAAALADFRDKSPAQKAAVLASLRTHGFQIIGKRKKARR